MGAEGFWRAEAVGVGRGVMHRTQPGYQERQQQMQGAQLAEGDVF